MFGMPATTPYDIKFHLLGIPVRIHPLFWVMTALLGWQGQTGPEVLIWIACVLVSILVHEFGHGLTTRGLFGNRPSIVLYAMGGLCYSEGEQRHPWKRALVILMGPGAGFLLFALVLILGLIVLGFVNIAFFAPVLVHQTPGWFNHLPEWANHLVQVAYFDLLFINLIWGIFNLLPIYPLDGGQLANVFLTMHDRKQGARRSYILGLVVAGILAIFLFTREEYFTAIFVASLAMLNFQLLQAAHYQQTSGSQFEEDDEWWRR